ncbi:PucR family transcriptional regulator [Nocardiopsis sp. NPDC055551]
MPTEGRPRGGTHPLADVPVEFADHFRAHVEPLIDVVVARIHESVPEYIRPGNQVYAASTRTAVREALTVFLDRVGVTDPPEHRLRERFRMLGEAEVHEGRSLDSLQTAMRTALVIMWRELLKVQEQRPELLPQRHIGPVAEAAFLFLEEMASAASEGYNQARARASGELQRRRRRLVDLLLSDPAPSPRAIADLASSAQWRVPDKVAVIVLQGDGKEAAPPTLPSDVLHDFHRADPCLVLPDPEGPGRMRTLERLLRGRHAAAGPAVDVTETALSLNHARETLQLVESGVVPADGISLWSEHLTPLLLLRNRELMREMTISRLAPMRELSEGQRERLSETLLLWLQHGYNAKRVAEVQHLHPQTVRYRLRRLTELFGDRLDKPDPRFELEMALRVERLLRSAPRT